MMKKIVQELSAPGHAFIDVIEILCIFVGPGILIHQWQHCDEKLLL